MAKVTIIIEDKDDGETVRVTTDFSPELNHREPAKVTPAQWAAINMLAPGMESAQAVRVGLADGE